MSYYDRLKAEINAKLDVLQEATEHETGAVDPSARPSRRDRPIQTVRA